MTTIVVGFLFGVGLFLSLIFLYLLFILLFHIFNTLSTWKRWFMKGYRSVKFK